MQRIIGRKAEIAILANKLESNEAEFVAIYGRRRVGKTFLVKNVVKSFNYTCLEISGLKDGSMKEQLANFIDAMASTFHKSLISQKPKNWQEAFSLLTQEIQRLPEDQKIVVFLDELPWLATKKSKLIQNLDYCWNNIWSLIPTFKLIVCGSAAAWMLDKLIYSKGGLYNRITRSILLKPFSLHETEMFLKSRKIKLNYAQILDLYMVMGGVPHYLKNIESGKSAVENIDQLCFTTDGILYEEFVHLFKSLFNDDTKHENIVRAIATKRYGISRVELLKKLNLKSGGDFEKNMRELEASGFIKKIIPYGKNTKDQYYIIIDEYTLFYIQWIEPIKGHSVAIKQNFWHAKVKTPAWQSWAGYAYESVCFKHIEQIMAKLEITNISCIIGSWRYIAKKNEVTKGAQIDLLFDRDDDTITICEIKYNDNDFTLTKQYALEIMERNKIFCTQLATNKQIFMCFITKEKVKSNLWSDEIIDQNIILDDLFTTIPYV